MYAKSYSFIIPMINLCLVDSLVGGGLNIIQVSQDAGVVPKLSPKWK